MKERVYEDTETTQAILFVSYHKFYKYYVGDTEYFENGYGSMYLEGFKEPWDDDEMNEVIAEITKYEKTRLGDRATFDINVINFKEKI